MNNDRELLEQAAKAAGMVDIQQTLNSWDEEGLTSKGIAFWNPLTDDGDALRLAVKLGMQMYIWQPNDGIGTHYTEIGRHIKEGHKDDPYAATRRAIVRAAAEIGKGMK